MAFPSKAYGGSGGFDNPTELPPGDSELQDGNVVSVIGDANLSLPSASTSSIGVIIHCQSGILTIIPDGSDNVSPPEYLSLSKDQSIQYSPLSTGWVVI